MSNLSERTLTWWSARISKWLITLALIGYALFGALLVIEQTNLFGLSDTLNLTRIVIIPGLAAIVVSLLACLTGLIGFISNIAGKTNLYLKVLLAGTLLPLLIIPFNLIWLSFYGY